MFNRRTWIPFVVLMTLCLLLLSVMIVNVRQVGAVGSSMGDSDEMQRASVIIRASEQISKQLYLPLVSRGPWAPTTLNATPIILKDTALVSVGEGGSLSTTIGSFKTMISFPPDAISESATLVVQIAAVPPETGNLHMIGDVLDIKLHTNSGSNITEFLKPFTITIVYNAEDVANVDERLLGLYYWNIAANQWEKIPTVVDTYGRQLTATLNHLTIFAVLEGLDQVEIPTNTPTATATAIPTNTPTATATAILATYNITGHVQKGPFALGSEITVRELDDNFVPTGRTFTGRIEDSTGRFTIRGTLTYPFVELAANGFYFNEISGSLSTAQISLLALADLHTSTTVNINLLTHLEHSRTMALIDSGLDFSAAKIQAQSEVLAAFNIMSGTIGNSETLDISQPGTGNAVLLAISIILQSNRSEAQLTELLSNLSNDLRIDGLLNSDTILQKLLEGMEYAKPRYSVIRNNIVARYAELGVAADVPDFTAYAFALDAVDPTIISTVPDDGATQEANAITITFSELMRHLTLTGNTVHLLNAQDSSVTGTLSISDSATETSIVFMPASQLTPGAYKLVVDTDVQDLAGKSPGVNKVIHFTHTPISQLMARNNGPTRLASTTSLTATVPGDSGKISYFWDLGDGASSVGSTVHHAYSAVGDYLAVVTANDGVSQVVTSTTVHVLDREINGLQAISSGITRLGTATIFTATIIDGSNVTYQWNFGDGHSDSGANIIHTYDAVGSYVATVTATNSVNQVVVSTPITVLDWAVAGLTATSSSPTLLGNATTFTVTVTAGSNITYNWSFGDGSSGSRANISHTYAFIGDYTAMITATNNVSQVVASTSVQVIDRTISGLQATNSGSGTTIVSGSAITFTATTAAGSNITYNWSFGDSTIEHGAAVSHSYAVGGFYTVGVTATNSLGSVSVQFPIHVVNAWTREEIFIPAGTFQMGCDSSNPAESCMYNEQPLHTVYLDNYTIDKYKVTNARYQACVDAGGCTEPASFDSRKRDGYYGTPIYADYPVIFVDWFQASDFCAWDGKRLLTEAEWEKAARGPATDPDATSKYPWGNGEADCTKANFNNCVGDTSMVGSYPYGASPYGVMDMAGDLWEWINDLYSPSYYGSSPANNPSGPATGENRVLRGGGWSNASTELRSAYRNDASRDFWASYVGFRCARSQ